MSEAHTLTAVAYTTNSWESPLATLRITAPYARSGIHLLQGTANPQQLSEQVGQADVVLLQRDWPQQRDLYRQVRSLAQARGIPVVYDLDDLLISLPEDHPDRAVHYYDAALLPMVRAIAEADCVTVSTPLLAETLKPLNPNIFILPNYLDERIWELPPLIESAAEKASLVIGYVGGASHTPDLQWLAPVILKLARTYAGRLTFHIIGSPLPSELYNQDFIQWEPGPTYNYAEFAAFLAQQKFDICIAPLEDNLFNRCKSSIKFLEYSAQGFPGVYSNLPPYENVVRHGENGFLASTLGEWEQHLVSLIESSALRYEIGSQAQVTVKRDWLLLQHAHSWANAYRDVISGTEMIQTKEMHPFVLKNLDDAQDYIEWLRSNIELLNTLIKQKEQKADHRAVRIKHLEQTLQKTRERYEQMVLERDSFSRQLWAIEHSRPWQIYLRTRKTRSQILGVFGIESEVAPDLTASGSASIKPTPGTGNAQSGAETDQSPITLQTPSGQTLFQPPEYYGHGGFALEYPPKPDVIVLPVMDWSSRTQRPQHIAMQFARNDQRVFFVRGTFYTGNKPTITPVARNIYEVCFPANFQANIYKDVMDQKLLGELDEYFQMVVDQYYIAAAVCIVQLPFWTPLGLKLRHRYNWKLVYDCMDYHPGFSSNSDEMLASEEQLSDQSDLVLTTSQLLLDEKSSQNPNTILAPNGVEFDHFHFKQPFTKNIATGLHSPVIGYYGAIADWFDTQLISNLARENSDWNFVLIGSTWSADIEPLRDRENIYLVGEVDYGELPGYLHAFDVAIIPFKKIPLTEATNPVKLFEYLSAGVPVVATDLNELRHYRDYVALASNQAEWQAAIEHAILPQTSEEQNARVQFARRNTWEERFKTIHKATTQIFAPVSVVILTYNNLDYTRLCLQSIFSKTTYPNYEVIVIDNASQDDTPAYLQEMAARHPNLRVILNEENTGFAAGNNLGAAKASGEYIIFLNNDTVVTRGWMATLVRHLRNAEVGMAGPVTNSSGNETLIPVEYRSLKDMDAFAYRYSREHADEVFEIQMLAFLCVGIRTAVFREIGPLDEGYVLGMFEDDDYAMRVRKGGYKIVCAEDVFIHHWGSASFSKLEDEKYRSVFEMNRTRFENKWGISWQPHQNRDAPDE